jgi:hypothetical protein
MGEFGTSCKIHDDHLQTFGIKDLENGFYHCDVCKRPLMVLHSGDLHKVEPIAIINEAIKG